MPTQTTHNKIKNLPHPPSHYHAGRRPRQSGEQCPGQSVTGLCHLCRQEVNAHRIKHRLRYCVNRGKYFSLVWDGFPRAAKKDIFSCPFCIL